VGYGQYSLSERPPQPAKPEKQKRLKHVFDDPTHVWATPRQSDGSGFEQEHARNPQGNIYFRTERDGTRTLYSYRDSYPIASRFEVKKKPVYLLRSGKPYSVTTARHFNMAESAVRNADRVFSVPYVTRYDVSHLTESGHHYGQEYPRDGKPDKATHAANVKDYTARIVEKIAEHEKARASYAIEGTHTTAQNLLAEVKAYCKVFGLKLHKLPKIPQLDAQRVADARARRAHLDATRDAREAQRKAEALAKAQQDIEAWKRGEQVTAYNWRYLTDFAFLRVILNQDTRGTYLVETSQGVKVPVSGRLGAANLLRFLQGVKQSGQTYQRNGHSQHIGEFVVDSFDGAILRAGCHRIEWEEIRRIASEVLNAEQKELEAGIAWG
jgi:hypothetical protein